MGYLNEKLYLQAPGHLDWKLKPFSSKAVALASIPYWQREIGQVVNVLEGGTTVRYWFKDGVLDADLVLLDTVTTDGTTITGTGTTTDPVKSNVFNADEACINLPQRSKIQGGEYIEYTDDAVNSKTIVDIKPDKLEEATELESEVIELEQAEEIETETLLNPDINETDPTKISFINNNPLYGLKTPRSSVGLLYHKDVIEIAKASDKELIRSGSILSFSQLEIVISEDLGGRIKSRLTDTTPYTNLFWPVGTPIIGDDSLRIDILPTGTYDKVNGYYGENHSSSSHWIVDENGELKIVRCYDDILNADIVDYDPLNQDYAAIRLMFYVADMINHPIGHEICVYDYDGNCYSAKKITEEFYVMMEDLKTHHYTDGTSIVRLPHITPELVYIDINDYLSVDLDYPFPEYSVNSRVLCKDGVRLNLAALRIDVSERTSQISPAFNETCRPKIGDGTGVRFLITGGDGSVGTSSIGDWVVPTYKSYNLYYKYLGYYYNHLALRGALGYSIISYCGQEKGYRVPSEADFTELFAPIPEVMPEYIYLAFSIKDHRFFKYPEFLFYDVLNELNLGLVPAGYRGYPNYWYNFKTYCRLHASNYTVNNSSYLNVTLGRYGYSHSIFNGASPFDGCSVRLCRPASDVELSFENGTVIINDYIDTDQNIYDGVKMYNLIWLTTNLRTESYANGDIINNNWTNTEGCFCNIEPVIDEYSNIIDETFLFNRKISDSLDNEAFAKWVSYSELVQLINDSKLQIGRKYVIYDYQTIWDDYDNVRNFAIEPEPLLVTASGYNELCPEAYSFIYHKDIIYYDYRNNGNLNGALKGYIYRRVDTLDNIDIPCDWRNIKYKRYKISGGGISWPNDGYAWAYQNYDDSLSLGITVDPNDFILCSIIESCRNVNVILQYKDDLYNMNNMVILSCENISLINSSHSTLYNVFLSNFKSLSGSLLNNVEKINSRGCYNSIISGSNSEIIYLENTYIGNLDSSTVTIQNSRIESISQSNINFMTSCNSSNTIFKCNIGHIAGCSLNGGIFKYNNVIIAQNFNFDLATHVYAEYDCEIYKRPDGTYRLRYYNDSDVLTIVSPTS